MDFKIAAHRGGNTWSGIFDAIEKGYDYIELDVHLSGDNCLIVQYSPVAEIAGERLYIQELMYNALPEKNKAGLLLLSDVLHYVKDKIDVVLDIKRGRDFYQDIGVKVADLIGRMDMYKNTWIISFDHKCLIQAKEFEPRVRIAPMYVARISDESVYWRSVHADGVEVCNDYLDFETVKHAHEMDMHLLGWCTEDIAVLKWLAELGIDIITIEQKDYYLDYLNTLKGADNE